MEIPKKYFQDRLILLLLSTNAFAALLNIVFILLRLDSGRSDSYIVQYRANLGLGAFQAGDSSTFLSFIVFIALILGLTTVLSIRIYTAKRPYSLVILSFGLLLLVLTMIVTNSLLVLR